MSQKAEYLRKEEKEIIELLGAIHNKFVKLERLHEWDHVEFMLGIHRCQNIVLSRAGMRQLKNEKEE